MKYRKTNCYNISKLHFKRACSSAVRKKNEISWTYLLTQFLAPGASTFSFYSSSTIEEYVYHLEITRIDAAVFRFAVR